MKKYIKIFLICLFVLETSVASAKYFFPNSNLECYIENWGTDEFWFCGEQSASCAGDKVNNGATSHWLYHGQGFTHTVEHNGDNCDNNCNGTRTFFCCNGTTSGSGRFVEKSSWIAYEENVTETLTGGTCTWLKRVNVCGQVDNPGDKCTEPTENCNQGFVSHNGKCAQACSGEDMAFESDTSSNCVSCEQTTRQGIVKGTCVHCDANQLFDENAGACVNKTSKLQVTILAHEACWLCSTPTDLRKCLKTVANGGSAPTNNTCALNPTGTTSKSLTNSLKLDVSKLNNNVKKQTYQSYQSNAEMKSVK